MEINVDTCNEFTDSWPIETFNKAYSEKGIKTSFIANMFDPNFLERTAVIILRTFIQKSERARTDQKYIIGLRFYSFGDMATIDLISLDKNFHREICYNHLERMNFPMWGENLKRVNHYEKTTRAPFIFAGGHLRVSEDDSVEFFGDSGDYTGRLLLSDSNSLARYISSVSGIKSKGEIGPGKTLVEHLLRFMFENKLGREFYQNLIADLYLQEEELSLNPQNMAALITMKVLDLLSINESLDFIKLMTEEMAEGLSRDIMIHSVARKIRCKK